MTSRTRESQAAADIGLGLASWLGIHAAQDVQKLLNIIHSRFSAIATRRRVLTLNRPAADRIEFVNVQFVLCTIPVARFGHWNLLFVRARRKPFSPFSHFPQPAPSTTPPALPA